MNSITYGIGYWLALLVVNVFSTDYHYTLMSEKKATYAGSFNFGYKTSKDFLLMEITLKNISPSVTAVHLKYNYEYYDEYSDTLLWDTPEQIKVNMDNNTSEVKFMILKHLLENHIRVDVELYSQQGKCNTTNIAVGREKNTIKNTWDKYQDDEHSLKYYDMNGNCLAPKHCEIVVDFKNKCPEQRSSTYFSCNVEESQYICTFSKPQNTLIYTFYQTYDNRSVFGPAPEMTAKVTKIFIKLELFDNNTSVTVTSWETFYTQTILWNNKLSLSAKDISEDYKNCSSVTTLEYSETTDVQYSCQKYEYQTNRKVHVGVINIDNNILTQDKPSIKRKFTMADNGTILCCLYYTSKWLGYVNEIRRVVENKTLLIYQPQKSISTNHTENKQQTKTPQTNWLLYLVLLFLGICILLLALYIIKQKRWCTNSHPAEETVELENNPTQNQVLYADLDFVRHENQPQRQNEEPHYANIIGVLHPRS